MGTLVSSKMEGSFRSAKLSIEMETNLRGTSKMERYAARERWCMKLTYHHSKEVQASITKNTWLP
jgi:hypothetical protein